ncbi:hypothetical protein CPB83DRAFT_407807 [Crepidotus variabilis]|uniref:Protein kinase domain-containing protein n=1 Tax=Crepidotus variabilis TaxID=179855 RepID=A0A9P6JUS8_9AGAR|nr:hypothetical protein CPB83DRAFT_407807 [Crepidotus variabilis]
MGEIVGPMPVKEFLETFLPCDETKIKAMLANIPNNAFDKIPSTQRIRKPKADEPVEDDSEDDEDEVEDEVEHNDEEQTSEEVEMEEAVRKLEEERRQKKLEKDMYPAMIKVLEKYQLCPGFTFRDTSNNGDPNSRKGRKWRPDIIGYKDGDAPSEPSILDFGKLALPIEVKTAKTVRTFRDPGPKVEGDKRRCFPFAPNPAGASEDNITLGQLVSVMTEMCVRQHRTHIFMVFLRDPDVRILRADRAGVIVSEAINYRTNSKTLAEFFLRFSQLSDAQRGLDPTVSIVTEEEAIIARRELANYKPKLTRPIVAIEVPTDAGQSRRVLAWGSLMEPESLTGRATRAYPVWDVVAKKICFLKDAWRAEHLVKEADVLKALAEGKVPNIPTIIAGGDLYNPKDPSTTFQKTATQDYIDAIWVAGLVGAPGFPLEQRFHHRILEDFVPGSINECLNARQMMTVIRDALIAHQKAYECGFLHRDISNNNVLISKMEGGGVQGILTDWDMALALQKDAKGNFVNAETRRQRYRTGTWYFMSAKLLQNPAKQHALQDDLESFFYLVVYLSLFSYTTSVTRAKIQKVIDKVFDQSEFDTESLVYEGGFHKQLMLEHGTFLDAIEFEEKLLSDWIDASRQILGQYLLVNKAKGEIPVQTTHTALLDQTNQILGIDAWTGTKYQAPEKPPPRKRILNEDPKVGNPSSKSDSKRQRTKKVGASDGDAYRGSSGLMGGGSGSNVRRSGRLGSNT